MRKRNDYLSTSLWYREVISDPYQVIAEFFFNSNIISHRKYIVDTLNAACSNVIWSVTSPGNFLYRIKLIESIINAGYLINKEETKNPLSIAKDEAFDPKLYFGLHTKLSAWDFFPRILSFEEYCDPYLVFRRLFEYLSLPEWKAKLSDLVEFALIKMSLFEAGVHIDALAV